MQIYISADAFLRFKLTEN